MTSLRLQRVMPLSCALLLLSSCVQAPTQSTTNPPPASPTARAQSEVLQEFGLSCRECMFPQPNECAVLKKQFTPLVARVTGARLANQADDCLRSDHPGDSQPCFRGRVYRFDSVQFLRQPADAHATDAFYGHDEHDLSAADQRSGIQLQPDKHYVIFAGHPDVATVPPADWYVTAACETPPSP